MKTIPVIIIVLAFSLLMPYSLHSAFASCIADVDYDKVYQESELVFKGTVVYVDNSPGPQKIHFDVHEVSKGEILEERYILENSEFANHGNEFYSSSSVDVGYQIGTTYKVYVTNGQTSLCTTKPTAPPSGYELRIVEPPIKNEVFCHFGQDSTPTDEIFANDLAVKAFLAKFPNATRSVEFEKTELLQGQVFFETENELLLIKFHQNENGCNRPSTYHYTFTSGEIDVTIKNTLGDFTEIINLIKLDEKKIEDFYTKNCNPIKLDFVLDGSSEPYFCKYDLSNSIEMSLQKHTGGKIEIHIPDKVMNALFYNCAMNDEYIVLRNGEEIHYEFNRDDSLRIFKMDLPQGYNKMEIIGFTNLANPGFCGSIWDGESRYISPLMQTKIGVDSVKVQCNDDLNLMLKPAEFTKPVCVTGDTREKLFSRGWIDSAPCHGGCGDVKPFDEYSDIWDESWSVGEWITDEDYCGEWCNQSELYKLGCDQAILSHLTKYSNLLSEEFDGTYSIEWIGLPEGVTVEKFEECVEIIYENRVKIESEKKPSPWDFRTITVYVTIPKGSADPENQFHLIPEEITIILGKNNTVSWINEDDTPSTLTSDETGWSTGVILPGEISTITFNQTGVFSYHGEPHPWKTGKIIVLED